MDPRSVQNSPDVSLDLFQPVCLTVLLVAYGFSIAIAPSARARAAEILVLVVAAWAGEHSCIELYAFYAYADGWWLRVGHVPLLVPLIWPMVVLSAREVAQAVWPRQSTYARALTVALLVSFDASLMEVVAVAAGYWAWFEPGYFGVPLIGIIGWGCFGLAAALWLTHARGRAGWLMALPIASVAATHALLLALWWALWRWVLRGDLGTLALAGFGVFAAGLVVAVLRTPAANRFGWEVTIPRILAASVFFALLVALGAGDSAVDTRWLWTHVALTSLPYLLAMRWKDPRLRFSR